MQESLRALLTERGISEERVQQVMDSGYYLRDWHDFFRTWTSVSDMMYGNKQFSSCFDTDDFIKHIQGDFLFPQLPDFKSFRVKNKDEILGILSNLHLIRYQQEGSLTFRGQPREYRLKRKVPNPVRSYKGGSELSIMSGLYRQSTEYYSPTSPAVEQRTLRYMISKLEPGEPYDPYRYDHMRIEQHYATQTAGLDVTFDIDVAIFFATHRFKTDATTGIITCEKIKADHQGVIYLMRFTQPSVKKSEFQIKEFDVFKSHSPERILRQSCGLPLFGDYERNIATTDIDCIIYLDKDFVGDDKITAEYLFPDASIDRFYAELLNLKDQFPGPLKNIVEYEWAR